jgi:DNA-binding XRE family transcriptional regulator
LENRLNEIIKKKGLKKTFIADQLGVSKQALNAWANGSSKPSLENAFKIAELLDCSLYDVWKKGE